MKKYFFFFPEGRFEECLRCVVVRSEAAKATWLRARRKRCICMRWQLVTRWPTLLIRIHTYPVSRTHGSQTWGGWGGPTVTRLWVWWVVLGGQRQWLSLSCLALKGGGGAHCYVGLLSGWKNTTCHIPSTSASSSGSGSGSGSGSSSGSGSAFLMF